MLSNTRTANIRNNILYVFLINTSLSVISLRPSPLIACKFDEWIGKNI